MTNPTTPTSGAAELPESGCSKHHLIHCSQCRHDNMVRDLRAENDRLTTQLAALATGQATAAQADSVPAPASGAKWQDISTAPKDGTRFVAVGQNYGLDSEKQHTCIAQWLDDCWIDVSDWHGASKLKYLTHWMPLPPLPPSRRS